MDVFRKVFKHQQDQDEGTPAVTPVTKNAPDQQQQSQPTPQNAAKPVTNYAKEKIIPPSPTSTTPTANRSQQHQHQSPTSAPNIPKLNLASHDDVKLDPVFGKHLDSPENSFVVEPEQQQQQHRSQSQNTARPAPPLSSSTAAHASSSSQQQQQQRVVEFQVQPSISTLSSSRNPGHSNLQQQQPPPKDEKGFFAKLFSSKPKDDEQHQSPAGLSAQSLQQQQQQQQQQQNVGASNFTNPPLSARSEAHLMFDQAPPLGNPSFGNNLVVAASAIPTNNNKNSNNTNNNNSNVGGAGAGGNHRSLPSQSAAHPDAVRATTTSNNNSVAATAAADGRIPVVAHAFTPATNAALRAQRSTVSVGFTGACTGCLVWLEERAWALTSVDSVFDDCSNEYLKLMQLAIRSPCIPKHFIPEALFVCITPEERQGGIAMLRFSDLYSYLLRPLCVSLSQKVCALHSSLRGYQIEVPISRRIFDEDHIFGGSALSAVAVTVVQTRSEYAWRALPDLPRTVNAVSGAPLFDEVGDVVAVIVGCGAMLSATSYRSRWDFERKTLARDSDREFIKKDYQLSRLRLGGFVAHHHNSTSATSPNMAAQNQRLVGSALDWDDTTLTTLECARALDEMFKSITPGGVLATITGGDGSRNRVVELPKPGCSQCHGEMFSETQLSNANRAANRQQLTRKGAGVNFVPSTTTTTNGAPRPPSVPDRRSLSPAQLQLRNQLRDMEYQNPIDELVAQDNSFRLVNQPSNAAMGLASSIPRLVRLGTTPTSWSLIHAMMAVERRVEVQAGSVRMVQAQQPNGLFVSGD